eukprot:TRINITY_DN16246_c0_g1_i2.p1 TRINITY_DN16246_c0_g1~~TRINITY_DN16246_c0_g1_i2.p1  ORF type:complete len:380 (+),score=68.58 TRINITY_DN16246_c0_g1_i2:284-1423(+)
MEKQVQSWLREGAATRMAGKTVFNPRSSRSHAVVMLSICWGAPSSTSRLRMNRGGTMAGAPNNESRVYLVDLAGSERAGLYALDPEQLKEGEHINLSLSALGRVVGALAKGGAAAAHVPYRDSALTWLLKDAITGVECRVCMVATVHPAHAVETASTLRYARQYSSLQSSTSTRLQELTAEVSQQQRRVETLRSAFEQALAGDGEGQIPWTRESLQGPVHCQTGRNARAIFEAHPYLSWTQAHQSKAAVRGQRRDRSGIGCMRAIVDYPTAREPAEKPDGRPAAGSAAAEAVENATAAAAAPPERAVEVVFDGRHGRPAVILWYPESALEVVQPPRSLLEAAEKLEREEAELARKRTDLKKARGHCARERQEWMSTAGV